MKTQESLCINTEFAHLTQLIKTFWSNSELIEEQIKQAFNMGLDRGRFWFDDMFSYDFHEQLTNEGGSLTMLRESSLDSNAKYHDALYILSYWLDSELTNVYRHHINKFKWSAERTQLSLSLMALIKDDTGLDTIKPVNMALDEQRKVIDGYQGYKALGTRSYSTAEYLSPSIAIRNEEYGEEFISQLLAQTFFHGIKCAEKKNKLELSALLIPLYTNCGSMPFNPDNGDELLSLFDNSVFMQYIQKVSAVEFSSTSEYQASLNADKADKDFLASLSEDEREKELERRNKQAEDYSNSIIDKILSEENDGTLELEEKKKAELYELAEKELKEKYPTEIIV